MSDNTKALVATYAIQNQSELATNADALNLARNIDTLSDESASASTAIESIQEELSVLGLKSVVATYDFAVDGGAEGIIDTNITIPANSIITYIYLKVETAPASAGDTGVIVCQLKDQVDIIAPITADGTATGIVVGLPDWTAANMVEVSTARIVAFEISTEALTAGVLKVFIVYNTY